MFKKQVKPKDIRFVQPIDKPAYFCYLICYQIKNKYGEFAYERKDLQIVGALKLFLERKEASWYEVTEEAFADRQHYYLYYYPLRRLEAQRKHDEQDQTRKTLGLPVSEETSDSLKNITEEFTSLIYK